MATTTFEAIRANQKTLIEALVPSILAETGFRAHTVQAPFRTWADANPTACFRRFQIRNELDYGEPEVSNTDVIYEVMSAEVVVSYPATLAKYGAEGERDLDDLIDSDWRAIDAAISDIGGQPDFLAGQSQCSRQSVSKEEGGPAVFLSLSYRIGFYRSV